MNNPPGEKILIKGIFSSLKPLTQDYDNQIHKVQVSQYVLAQRIDSLTLELETLIASSENKYQLRGHLQRLTDTRKKLVWVYQNMLTIQDRMTKMQKAVATKYPTLNQRFDTFGVPLVELMKRKSEQNEPLPKVVSSLIKRIKELGLEKEGIFRISGLMYDVRNLQQRFDEGDDVDLSKYTNVHVLAHLLKQYLRDLPVPVCTYECYEIFLSFTTLQDKDKKIEQLKMLLEKLPKEHYNLMEAILELAFETSKYEEKNKMNPKNLAIVFGMNLFQSQDKDPMKAMKDNENILKISEFLIGNYPQLFNK